MSKVRVVNFEPTSKGENTHLYIIENNSGASVTLCDLGASVVSIKVPDKNVFQRAVKDADDAGQQDDRAQYAEDNALAHHDAEVTAEREAHEAKSGKAGNRRN